MVSITAVENRVKVQSKSRSNHYLLSRELVLVSCVGNVTTNLKNIYCKTIHTESIIL